MVFSLFFQMEKRVPVAVVPHGSSGKAINGIEDVDEKEAKQTGSILDLKPLFSFQEAEKKWNLHGRARKEKKVGVNRKSLEVGDKQRLDLQEEG